MFPPHDPYHIIIPNLSNYLGCQIELSDRINNPSPRQSCNYCNDLTNQLNVLLNGLRPFLQQVRNAYSRVPTSFDYNSRYQKGIYMLAYFPFYIEPIYYSFEGYENSINLMEEDTITISILGGGALPELLGLSKLIGERRGDIRVINVKVFDIYQNWNAEIGNCTKGLIPHYYSGEVLINTYQADLINLSNEDILNISDADIIVMQNTINDLAPENYGLLKNNLVHVWNNLNQGSHIIIIDLNFNEVRQVMKSVEEELIQAGGKVLSSLNLIPVEHQPNIPFCSHLERMLFSNQSGLLPRRRVNYYRFIMKK